MARYGDPERQIHQGTAFAASGEAVKDLGAVRLSGESARPREMKALKAMRGMAAACVIRRAALDLRLERAARRAAAVSSTRYSKVAAVRQHDKPTARTSKQGSCRATREASTRAAAAT